MKNRILSVFLCLVLLMTTVFTHVTVIANSTTYDVWDGTSVSTELSGSGTDTDPYLIKSAADFVYLTEKSKSAYLSGQYYLLTTNIDLNEKNILIANFSGTLDGNGHEIKGVKIVNNTLDNVGFIRTLKEGTVKNLTVTGSVWGKSTVGGLVGTASGNAKLYNCVINMTVKAEKNANNQSIAGGIVGYGASLTITDCVNNSSVSATGLVVGGIVGNIYPSAATTINIYSCINNGEVKNTTTGTAASCTGGFVGNIGANATVNFLYSRNNGSVTSGATDVGGFVGTIYGNVLFNHCINTGTVSGNYAAGGFIGWNRVASANSKTLDVRNCVNMGTIKATRTDGGNGWIDGILGVHSGGQNKSKLTQNKVYSVNGCLDFGTSVDNQSTATTYIGTRRNLEDFTASNIETLLGFLYVLDENNKPALRNLSFEGNGSSTEPYILKTKEDLIMLSQMVTVAQVNDFADKLFILANDINLEGDTRFVGIGNGYKSFKGDFDGKDFTVSGVNIGDGSGTYSAHPQGIGFFGMIGGTNERKISNLNVKGNVYSTAQSDIKTYVGGLVGRNQVKLTLSNCSFDGTVYSAYTTDANSPAASGLVCSVEGALDINQCSVFGKIDGYGRSGSLIGSLNANFAVNITNSYSLAEVTGKGANTTTETPTAGGLLGFVGNGVLRLNNSFFAGTAPAERSSGMGGPVINHFAAGDLEVNNVYYLADTASEFTEFNVGVNKTAAEFANGSVLALLNANGTVFEQGGAYPKFPNQEISGGSGDINDDDLEDEDDGKTYDVWDGSSSTSLSGTGSDIDPYIIATGADLKYFANQVNSGNDYSGQHIKLTANIDLDKIDFEPIGNRAKWFRGIFNGNGNTVKNLKIVSESKNGIAFFGGCHNAKIKNLTVKGTVKGTVCEGATPVAGLVAIVVGGSMEDCAFIGTVYSSNATATYSNYPSASGLVCNVEGAYIINRCYVSGKIDGYGRSGGLVGSVNGAFNLTVSNSYCDAIVTGIGANITTTAPTAGGLIGFLNQGIITLENCYFVGTAPAPRANGMSGQIINHFAGGTLNCINTYYDIDKNPIEETENQKFGVAKTSSEFKDGTVLALLNDGLINPIFEQGENYPVIIPPVADNGTIRDRYVRKYTFDNHPGDIETFNSNPNKYQNDGYYIDTFDDEKRLGARLYNYGRYNNNAILAPSTQYANGEGYGTVYSASLGGVFSHVDVSEIKSNAFYKFSVDAKVVDVEKDVTVEIGLFRATGSNTYGQLAFQDSDGNTYDTAIKTIKLTLDKTTDYKTYTVQISGAEIRSFLENYSNNANVLYFGVYCPEFINKSAYKGVVGMALDNFVAFETAIPDDYIPADSLPVVDILNNDHSKNYGEHLYNIIENCSFEKELSGVWAELPNGFSVKTASNNGIFGQKYLSANAESSTVKLAVPFKLTINKFYTFGISTRTSDDAEYRIYVTDSLDGAPLYDVDDSKLKFLIDEKSENGEIVRSGIYFRNTMKTTATQYLVFEVNKGTVDFDEITLTNKSTTKTNKNYYEKQNSETVKVYDPNTSTEKEVVIPFGKTVYDIVKEEENND